MSERSSSVLVGAFVVGAIVIAVAGVLFFAGGGLGKERGKIVMVFDGSLRGLTLGAPVALRGVTIGKVTDIDLRLNVDEGEVTMVVEAEIDRASINLGNSRTESIAVDLVQRGLRAQLDVQSLLTGLLYIQLDFHPDSEAVFADVDSTHPQIPTIPTELEQLRKSLESVDFRAISTNINSIATGLDQILNNPDMQALPGAFRDSLRSLDAATTSLQQSVGEHSPALKTLLDNGSTTLLTLNSQLPGITENLGSSIERLDEVLQEVSATATQLADVSEPDSPTRRQLNTALEDFSLAARALRSLARSLEEHPESLLRGRRGEVIE